MRGPATQPAVPVAAERTAEPTAEELRQRDLVQLQAEVVPQAVEAVRAYLVGGGKVEVVRTWAEGTTLGCELLMRHKLYFRSRLWVTYQNLNGALKIEFDDFDNGKRRLLNYDETVRIDIPGTQIQVFSKHLAIIEGLHEIFRLLPVRHPTALRSAVVRPTPPVGVDIDPQALTGAWRRFGNPTTVELIYSDDAGALVMVNRYGEVKSLATSGPWNSPGHLGVYGDGWLMGHSIDAGVWWMREGPRPMTAADIAGEWRQAGHPEFGATVAATPAADGQSVALAVTYRDGRTARGTLEPASGAVRLTHADGGTAEGYLIPNGKGVRFNKPAETWVKADH